MKSCLWMLFILFCMGLGAAFLLSLTITVTPVGN
jgi:hypothetical protein